jgi:hypothetical protein
MKLRSLARMLVVVAALAVLAGSAVPTSAAAGDPAHRSGWVKVSVPTFASLLGVSGTSPTDVWAVGYLYNQMYAVYRPVADHFDGTRVVSTRIPRKGRGYSVFNAVAAVSADDVWAAGYWNVQSQYTGSGLPLFEHWNGTSWTLIEGPNVGAGQIWGLAAVASSDVWAVGVRDGHGTLVEHWNGTSWSRVPAPNAEDNGSLYGLSARSANDVWAAGSAYNGPELGSLVLHWDGSAWTRFPSANSSDEYNELHAIDASSSDLWAVGNHSPGLGYFQLSERYHGSAWTVLNAPNGQDSIVLSGVAVDAGGTAWAVSSSYSNRPLIQFWNGAAWQTDPVPGIAGTGLWAVARVGSTLWAVGNSLMLRRG